MNDEEQKLEEWRCTPSLRPDIQVSNLGRIRRYVNMTQTELIEPKISSGLAIVNLYGKQHYVHRLIAEAFLPKPEDCNIVKHESENRLDNRVSNLKWASSKANLDSKQWEPKGLIYCKELNKVFKTLRSATYITGLPQDIIARAIQDNCMIAGLTFVVTEADDLPSNIEYLSHINFDTMYMIAKSSQSPEELHNMAVQYTESDRSYIF